MKKFFSLIGFATVAAGIGAAVYINNANKKGLSLEESLSIDKRKFKSKVNNNAEIILVRVVSAKKNLDKAAVKIIRGLDDGLLILEDFVEDIE